MKIKDLSELKGSHLAWRLDHKTACGYLTACKVARLQVSHMNNMEVYRVFMWAGCSELSARIHAGKVERYSESNTKGLARWAPGVTGR